MNSIASLQSGSLEGLQEVPTIYRHVLRVSADEIEMMNRDQLVQLCLEQYSLLLLLISIIRNAQTELATRIVQADYVIETVQRCVRKSIQDVTERMPVLYSGEIKDKTGKRVGSGKIGIAERLGIHSNTVSTVYSKMEAAGLIKKDYRVDEGGHQKHIDVSMQPAFLLNPALEDRKTEDKHERKPKNKPVCPKCGSSQCDVHVVTVCRECQAISDEVQTSEPPVDEELPHEATVVESDLAPLAAVPQEETPLYEETPGDAAEAIVRLTEEKRGERYSGQARTKQLEAARGIVSLGITQEQYQAAYDERNDEWWRERNGTLEVTDLWRTEHESGEHRIVRVLARLKSKQHRTHSDRQSAVEGPTRMIWWNGREIPEEQAYREGYEGGFERFKKGDHPDDDLEAVARRLLAEGKIPNYPRMEAAHE